MIFFKKILVNNLSRLGNENLTITYFVNCSEYSTLCGCKPVFCYMEDKSENNFHKI